MKTVSMTGEPKAGKTRYQLLNQMKAARAAGDSEKQKKHSESICSRRLWFGTVLHLWRKRSSRRIRHGTENLILGFDFGEKYSQFCCYDRGTHTAVSIPVKEGEEAVEFPTAIAKNGMRKRGKQDRMQKNLLTRKTASGWTICTRSAWDPASARSKPGLHAGRSPWHVPSRSTEDDRHRASGPADPGDDDHHGHLTRPFVENVREAYKIIGLPRGRAYLQEHDESFYCHVLNQKPELWSRKVGLFS